MAFLLIVALNYVSAYAWWNISQALLAQHVMVHQ